MRLLTISIAVFLAVCAAAAAHADVFRILEEPRDAVQARVDLFQQATQEIDAFYFLARNDRVTLAVLALMRDARRRGVPSVRLIVDANFEHIPKPVLAYLQSEGVEIRVYHPISLRHPAWLFRRMHDKVVVVDGRRYITGGRNLAESYFGLAKRNYIDRDVYVDGKSALEADGHFEQLWVSRHVADLHVRVTESEKQEAARVVDAALRDLVAMDFIRLDTHTDWSSGQNDQAAVSFLHDPIGPEAGPRVASRLAEIFESATTSILVESPYLVPSTSLLLLFERKAAEGVKVVILTNSFHSTDGLLPQVACFLYRRRALRAGIDVREYKGPEVLHAKSAVVDGKIALIGSYNIDPRSENLNTEVMCAAADEASAHALTERIEAHMRNAWVDRAPAHSRERLSRGAAFRIWAAKLLLPFVQGQL